MRITCHVINQRSESNMRPALFRRLSTASASAAHAGTLRWVDEMIVGMNLCPFTAGVRKRPTALRCTVCSPPSDDALLSELTTEVRALAAGSAETALLVIAPATPWAKALHADFAPFLSLGWKVEERLAELEDSTLALQLAMFHPLAVRSMYACGEEGETADYAMRSPHPTLHLLRTSDVQAVPPASAAVVPERNRARLERIGLEKLRDMYADLRAES